MATVERNEGLADAASGRAARPGRLRLRFANPSRAAPLLRVAPTGWAATAALLAALVAVAAFSDHEEWSIGADTVGVAAGGLVLWRGAGVITGGVVAAVVTALVRAL